MLVSKHNNSLKHAITRDLNTLLHNNQQTFYMSEIAFGYILIFQLRDTIKAISEPREIHWISGVQETIRFLCACSRTKVLDNFEKVFYIIIIIRPLKATLKVFGG